MTLRRRIVITALLLTVPVAAAIVMAIESRRSRDARLTLERMAAMHLTETVRDACQADPQWFLAGPRTGRPPLAVRNIPDADVLLPRPDPAPLPIDVFAYDQDFNPMSTAGPPMPRELRAMLRPPSPETSAISTYATDRGTGLQIVRATGWTPGPCAFLAFRMQAVPGLWWQRVMMFTGLSAAIFGVAYLAALPTILRIRRVTQQAGSAARDRYRSIAPDAAKDDISAVSFIYNEAAAEVHRRSAETQDRIESLRRFLHGAEQDLAGPLTKLVADVTALATGSPSEETRANAGAVLKELYGVSRRLRNLIAAAELRMHNDPLARQPVDLAALVRDAVDRYRPLAHVSGVTIEERYPAHADADLKVRATYDATYDVHGPMLALALDNVLDNAICYNRKGGRVVVSLEPRDAHGFRLRVTDTGRGVEDDHMKALTAIRRFRGDESWNRRPGAPGLGLALSREIADRSGLTLELHRPAAGGFEVEITDAHS
jgi:signal transduction histidine kinase